MDNIAKIDIVIREILFGKKKKPTLNEICKLIDSEKKNSFIDSPQGINKSLNFLFK